MKYLNKQIKSAYQLSKVNSIVQNSTFNRLGRLMHRFAQFSPSDSVCYLLNNEKESMSRTELLSN